jgi:hypothetical protein
MVPSESSGNNADLPHDFVQAIVPIYSGIIASRGATGSATVSSLISENVQITVQDQTEKLPDSPPGNSVTRKVRFRTPPLDRFKEHPITVTLESKKPLNGNRWKAILERVEVAVEETPPPPEDQKK